MRSKIPKFIVAILLVVLSFSLTSCRLIDKLDTWNFNPMLNYLNINSINIYYLNNINDLPNDNSIAKFDFKEHDKAYYKKQKVESTNEFESQLSKYGIAFTDDIYKTRYCEPSKDLNGYNQYFYIDISVKNFKSTDVKLECEGYENIIVTYNDNSLKMYQAKDTIDTWKLDSGKKVKNILVKCKFYDGTGKAPRIEHLQ